MPTYALSRLKLRTFAHLAVMLLLGLGLVLAGPTGQANAASDAKIKRAVQVAVNQKGDPYRYGAAGPRAFDCSGLIYFSYRKAGISVPRTSGAQAGKARRIAKSNLRRGDLMFFHNSGRVYHVAVFMGRKNGRAMLLHSPRTGSRVHVTSAWTTRWFAGTLRG